MHRRWGSVRSGCAYLLVTLWTAAGTVLGLPVLCTPVLARSWAGRHRARAARLLGTPADALPPPATRRALGWLAVQAVAGLAMGLAALLSVGNLVAGAVVTVAWWVFPADDPPHLFAEVAVTGWGDALTWGPLQVAVLAAVTYLGLPPLARAHARLCQAVLAPTGAELARRVDALTRSRTDVLDAHRAELRRIERDLHDGTQARLVAVALRLAVARESLSDSPEKVATLLRDAHENVEEAMTELRAVLRTVYPPILADRGLAGAVTTAAAGCGVPVRLDLGEIGQVPAAVEAVAYFVVVEALTNVAKHSGATGATVRVDHTGDRLSVTVTDDGAGGADEARGSGLRGIRQRVAALDGTATVTSPVGGPTVVQVELPCE